MELRHEPLDPHEADVAPRSDVVGDDAQTQGRDAPPRRLYTVNADVPLDVLVAVVAHDPRFHKFSITASSIPSPGSFFRVTPTAVEGSVRERRWPPRIARDTAEPSAYPIRLVTFASCRTHAIPSLSLR